jgi:CDP-glucose 4,6-dehydratase
MKRTGRRIFVTGATGLLGAWLVRKCLEEGAEEVVVLVRDRVPESLFYAEDAGFRLHERTVQVRGDLEDFSVLERTLNEYQINEVFHLGAQTQVVLAQQSPIGTFRANIEGTWNLLEAIRIHQARIQSVLVASSDKAYGSLSEKRAYVEEDALKGLHPYDVSKSCTDLLAQSYAHSYGLPVTISRCGNLFGPGDLNPQRLIPSVILSALKSEKPVLRSDGTLVRECGRGLNDPFRRNVPSKTEKRGGL